MDRNFLDELVNRLNEQIGKALENHCHVDKWIQYKLDCNRYICFKNGKFEVDIF
jgi:hypothetical protein